MSFRTEQLTQSVILHGGDCLTVLASMGENSIDSCVTDPPYHLTSIVKRFGADNAAPAKSGKTGAYARASAGFMGKRWDGGDVAFQVETWKRVWRVLKPGAHLIAFSGTRTYHRMACAIEDAGFEIRDQIGWAFGSGFPKSHDVSKAIDRTRGGVWRGRSTRALPNQSVAKGIEYERVGKGLPVTDEAREWDGWGTALKPAWEPCVIARKPLDGTVADNVLKWGVGALNIDGCRIGTTGGPAGSNYAKTGLLGIGGKADIVQLDAGRWPANIIHDGSDEVVGAFPETSVTGRYRDTETIEPSYEGNVFGKRPEPRDNSYANDAGSAARFFYSAKADSDDRLGSKHPTVKPVDLIQYLVRLVTPPRGLVLDCFAGTGTCGEACIREGMRAVLIEREEEYQEDIRRRMNLAMAGPDERARESIKAKTKDKPVDAGPLFGGSEEWRGGAGRFTDTLPTKTNDWANRAQEVTE